MKEYVIRFLNGTLNASEKARLLAWMKSSEENKRIFLRYYHQWEHETGIHMNVDKTNGWQRFVAELGQTEPNKLLKRRIWYRFSVAAACLLLLLLSFYYLKSSKQSDILQFAQQTAAVPSNLQDVKLVVSKNKTLVFQSKSPAIIYGNQSIQINNRQVASSGEISKYNQLIVPYGKRSVLTLSDGTRVWVNAGTRLIYPAKFDTRQREIYVSGEVYLEVVHHDEWPFIVRTNEMNVRVLGTKFDVSSYDKDATEHVVLVSGRVSVDRGSSSTVIRPNYMYALQGNRATLSPVDVDPYISWIKGIYSFDSESLKYIFDKLERYYNVHINYDSSVAQLKCTGKLDLEQGFDKLMNGLSKTAPIAYEQKNGSYYIHLKKLE